MKLLLFVISFSLFSCATSYQKMGYTGGYKDMNMGNDIYKVTFKGNAFTSAEKVQDLFLRRCAELTLENKATHFVVMNDTERTQNNYSSQTDYYTGKTQYYNVQKREYVGVIKTYKGPQVPTNAIEAKTFLSNF